jgi:hypothetical protein
VGALLCAIPALATHSQPDRAEVLAGRLVTAYERCTAPNAMTDGSVPACVPPVRSDPLCGFGERGRGKFKVKVHRASPTTGEFITFKAVITGLDPQCQGEELSFDVQVSRSTGHNCQGAACTVVDFPAAATMATCIVDARGRCRAVQGAPLIDSPLPLVGQFEGVEVSVSRAGLRTFETGLVNPGP